VWEYDIFGGLVRFLDHIGGWSAGEDLHVLTYDWRRGVLAAAEELDRLVDRVRGASDDPVDVVCVSTGGLVVRAWLAAASARVRRVVYVGTPQRGSYMALDCLATGLKMAPGGRNFPPLEVARVQTVWDALPHPDEKVFIDEDGRALDIDHYDPAAWRRLGLDPGVADLDDRLARARAAHAALDAGAARHPEAFVIGGRHLPTPSRLVVRAGRARMTPCTPQPDDPWVGLTYEPGDATLVARSLCAVPGLRREDAWFVTPKEHRMLPADRDVMRLCVEALLATDRAIPHTSLVRRPRNGAAS
jgi:pimeloyl-ACP methyl ester carboxylesterase